MARWALQFDEVFTASRVEVFSLCASHGGMGAMFPGKTVRIRRSDDPVYPDGLGSARLVKMGPFPPIEETVTVFLPNERYEYRVTRGGPVRNHLGVMRFSDRAGGTRLDYTVSFEGRLPFTGWLIRQALHPVFARAMANLHRALDR